MIPLTPRQQQVLELIRDELDFNGRPPTRAEIARTLGFNSANAAESHLRALAKKGVIELISGSSRGIRLLGSEDPSLVEGGLPLVGRVAAGAPILSVENVEERFRIDRSIFSPPPDYLLRVNGDSMVDAGIWHDDLLAVHQTREASNGQIVVARVQGIEGEVTVKRYRRKGSRVWLLPENRNYQPIEIDLNETELVIEGRCVGIIRRGEIL